MTTVTDVDGTYTDDEERAQLIERTAMAIYQGKHQPDLTPVEQRAWKTLWNGESPAVRIRCRNQARAALAASELLERIEELEERIAAAQAECVIYAGELNAQALADKVRRVSRVLAKPLPDPKPIGIKP